MSNEPEGSGMTEMWTIGGSWPYFEVALTDGPSQDFLHASNDALLNGIHPSRVAALASLVASLEETRRELSGEIARHKRALRRAQAPKSSPKGDL